MLPTKAIEEFIEIHQKQTGVTLSIEEATPIAQRFFEGISMLFEYKQQLETNKK